MWKEFITRFEHPKTFGFLMLLDSKKNDLSYEVLRENIVQPNSKISTEPLYIIQLPSWLTLGMLFSAEI